MIWAGVAVVLALAGIVARWMALARVASRRLRPQRATRSNTARGTTPAR